MIETSSASSLAQLGILVSEEKRRDFLKIWQRGQKNLELISKVQKKHQQNPTENLDKLLGYVVSVQLFRELGFARGG